jgi:hypothetical protein
LSPTRKVWPFSKICFLVAVAFFLGLFLGLNLSPESKAPQADVKLQERYNELEKSYWAALNSINEFQDALIKQARPTTSQPDNGNPPTGSSGQLNASPRNKSSSALAPATRFR